MAGHGSGLSWMLTEKGKGPHRAAEPVLANDQLRRS